MAYTKWNCEFYSQTETSSGTQGRYRINIIKKTGASGTNVPFLCTSEGFTMTMEGGDDSMIAPIKTTSVTFNFIIQDTTTDIIDDLNQTAVNNEDEWAVLIERYNSGWKRYWIGIMLADLVEVQDAPVRILSIKAVDGLTKLKYKQLPLGAEAGAYNGTRSMIQLIKICLNEIPTTHDDFDLFDPTDSDKKHFIAHTPFYYNQAMAGSGSLDATWKNSVLHDPLALTKVNTAIFQDENGIGWSLYKILETILTTFQLRIMMTPFKDDEPSGEMYGGNCLWYLQAPLLWHGNDNNDPYNNDQRIFYHHKTIDDDTAIHCDQYFVSDDGNPSQRVSGGMEGYVAPLLSYKTMYFHNKFFASVINLDTYNSVIEVNQSETYFSEGGDAGGTYGLEYFLTNRQNYGALGFTDPAQDGGAQQIAITGSLVMYPFDYFYYISDGWVGYESGEEYFNNWAINLGGGIYGAFDNDSTFFPRMGLRVQTFSENTIEGEPWLTTNFWLGDYRFGMLHGSVPWQRTNGIGYNLDQYPDNYRGLNPVYGGYGQAYDKDNPTTTVYENSAGIIQWGQDIIGSNLYWWGSSRADTTAFGETWNMNTSEANDNHWAFFAPYYHDTSHVVMSLNSTFNPIEWANDMFEYQSDYLQEIPFTIITPNIPWDRGEQNGVPAEYSWSMIQQIQLYWGFKRDQVYDGLDGRVACCKDWNHNKEEYAYNRGIHWAYSLNDVNVYLLGVEAGANSFDYSYGWYTNSNGEPSEELEEPIDIVIGDAPPFNPYADGSVANTWGGDYMGQFKIFLNAIDGSGSGSLSPEDGLNTQDWRTTHQTSGSEDMDLHKHRAKQMVAHHYQLKQKLNLKFVDTQYGRTIEQSPFGQLYTWSSGDWSENQSGVDIAFIATGGSFVAGTGEMNIQMEDCVTYSKSGIVDNSYSSMDG